MARRKWRLLRVTGWILTGFIGAVVVIVSGFYLGRGWIMSRALETLNEKQPGEVQMHQVRLIPLRDFPKAVFQLRDVSYYEYPVHIDSLYQEPILYFHELYVSLGLKELVRGELEVSKLRLENGFVRLEVHEDSVTNLEYALGIRFGEDETKEGDTLPEGPFERIDLDLIEMTNILMLYENRTRDDRVNVQINQLESRFSYLPEMIEAGLKLNVDINKVKYLTYSLENKDDVSFDSEISFDKVSKQVKIKPSSLNISGLELETWGDYEYRQEPFVNLAFKATNRGLDVLNFIFLGVLDMEEIEQIGAGSMYLDGTIIGSLKNSLPVFRVNGTADRIGFRIKSLQRDVTDISFDMFATNGRYADLSEGEVQLRDFTASFPEGYLKGDIQASNLVSPAVELVIHGELELEGLQEVIKTDRLKGMQGDVTLDANVKGRMDYRSEEFLSDIGSVTAKVENVGFIWNQDTISQVEGELFMVGNVMGVRNMNVVCNGNSANIEVKLEDFMGYLLGIKGDVFVEAGLESKVIYPGRLLKDTAVTSLVGDQLRGLHFKAGARITSEELDLFFDNDSLPEMQLSLDSFGIKIPVYADISEVNAALTIGRDTLVLHLMEGIIGESSFSFAGQVNRYRSLIDKDSGEVVDLGYILESDLMRAEDLLSYKEGFLLPESYRTEYLDDFHLSGSLTASVDGLLMDSADLDFGLNIHDLGWRFRYYPLAFKDFHGKVRREGKELNVEDFQGVIGESNLKLSALVGNFTDSARENLYGSMVLEADLLDFNELLNYQLPEALKDTAGSDSVEVREPVRLDQIEMPDFEFNVDVGELRYGKNKIFGMKGRLRSSSGKIFYLEQLKIAGESGGTIVANGQLNVTDSVHYLLNAELALKDVDIHDLDFEMQSGEETYTLKENFAGIVSGSGTTEVFITPGRLLEMDSTTAEFNLVVKDGALINFTPLRAAGKYLDNKDLDLVKFATLQMRGPVTLADSKIAIPLMNVESTVGQFLIEGEQRLNKSYLYLVRVPFRLVKEGAASVLTDETGQDEEDKIQKMQSGNFVVLTVWGDGEESDVKGGDEREKFRKRNR
ncbi:MAG: hypothetical protein ABFS10_09680 [Bacteroidota bacterium]